MADNWLVDFPSGPKIWQQVNGPGSPGEGTSGTVTFNNNDFKVPSDVTDGHVYLQAIYSSNKGVHPQIRSSNGGTVLMTLGSDDNAYSEGSPATSAVVRATFSEVNFTADGTTHYPNVYFQTNGTARLHYLRLVMYFNYQYYTLTISSVTGGEGDTDPDTTSQNKINRISGTTVNLYHGCDPGYRFVRWDTSAQIQISPNSSYHSFIMPAGNVTVTPVFELIPYTITWKNYDGTVISTETYTYHQTPETDNPTRPSVGDTAYVFDGWSPSVVQVEGDAIYTATYRETAVHKIVWTNPRISVAQNDYEITVTKGGFATDNYDYDVIYKLFRDNINVADFDGDVAQITITDSDLETTSVFSVVATNPSDAPEVISAEGASQSFYIDSLYKTVGYYADGEFVPCMIKRYTGQAWEDVEPRYYTNSAWKLCSVT